MLPTGQNTQAATPKVWHRIATGIASLGVLATLWAGVAGWIVVPNSVGGFFRRVLGYESPKHEQRAIDTTGTWRAKTKTGKQYILIQDGQNIQVQLLGAARSNIGYGTIVGNKVSLTLWIDVTDDTRAATRMAYLQLTLIDPDTLLGTFSGSDAREYGVITFKRMAAG